MADSTRFGVLILLAFNLKVLFILAKHCIELKYSAIEHIWYNRFLTFLICITKWQIWKHSRAFCSSVPFPLSRLPQKMVYCYPLVKYYLKYWHRTYSSSDLTMILQFWNVSISLFFPLSLRRIFSLISCLKSQRIIFQQEIVSIKKKPGLGWNDSGINWKRYSFIYGVGIWSCEEKLLPSKNRF